MISPELLRRCPVFADLSDDNLVTLTKVAADVMVEAQHIFFETEEELDHFYVVLEGEIGIWTQLPDRDAELKLSHQLSRHLTTKEIILTTVEPGEIFAWSALIPPYKATSAAKAITPARVVAFDCRELRKCFEEDYFFGYQMMQKTAQVIRKRLRAIRFKSLAFIAE
jgi:CRP-like cAMP-binding protein